MAAQSEEGSHRCNWIAWIRGAPRTGSISMSQWGRSVASESKVGFSISLHRRRPASELSRDVEGPGFFRGELGANPLAAAMSCVTARNDQGQVDRFEFKPIKIGNYYF